MVRETAAPAEPARPLWSASQASALVLEIAAGESFRFVARLEEEAAPQTVEAFRRMLPLASRLIHARWSGEACWIPFGELEVGIGPENATCYPPPGHLLLYPGGVSETELLFPYGSASFASKAGALPRHPFATGVDRPDGPPQL